MQQTPNKDILNKNMQQEQALKVLQSGANVFLTGEPGAGKTHTIEQYIRWLKEEGAYIAITASTGIAASHIGGRTIHSWSGIGIRETLSQEEVKKIIDKGKTARQISDADVLIIDEISMLNGTVVDTLDMLLRTVRMDTNPFGGIQIIFVGDFFQLPPVSRGNTKVPYAFESEAWEQAGLHTCYLTEQHRQEDAQFLDLLRAVRKGALTDEHYTLLQQQDSIAYEAQEPTILHAHNREVDQDNMSRLNALTDKEYTFEMEKEGTKAAQEALTKGCTSPEILRLKKDAVVMFTKNNPEKGFINGTIGTVCEFDTENGLPIVETADGRTIIAERMAWEMMEGEEVIASIKQVPLRLAWSITIHKSQGASLDAAKINLSRVFEEGQGYVALSRVRSLAGLQLVGGMTARSLAIAPTIRERDEEFQEASKKVERSVGSMKKTTHTPQEDQKRVFKRRPQKKDTHIITLEMLKEGKDTIAIARERGIQEKTILNHLETLADEKKIHYDNLLHLLPANWNEIYRKVSEGIQKHGDDYLKPLYEYCNEQYDYSLITLARITHRLQQQEQGEQEIPY